VVDATPLQFTDKEDPVPILEEAGLPQGQAAGVRKIPFPPGLKAQTLQPVGKHCSDCTILALVCCSEEIQIFT
jgi:hypothetical protein